MTPFTIEKMAVLAPMPSASVSSATAVKPGAAPQHAQPVPHVARHVVEPRQAALIAQRLHRLRRRRRPRSRRARGVVGRRASALRVVGGQFEMQPELLLEIVDRAGAGCNVPQRR